MLFTELESKMWQEATSVMVLHTWPHGINSMMVRLWGYNNEILCSGIFYERNAFLSAEGCATEWIEAGGFLYIPDFPHSNQRMQQVNPPIIPLKRLNIHRLDHNVTLKSAVKIHVSIST